MKHYSRLMQWGSDHQPDWFVVLRVALGLLLFTKGIDFISNMVQFQDLLEQQKNVRFEISWVAFAIAWAHIFGGLFIVLGLFTRAFCLVQLPIVTAALIVSISSHILSGFALFEIIAAFLMLLLFVLGGGGTLSLDHHYSLFEKEKELTLQP
ncbi:MAG: DoxX family protein [Lacibacter sp.]